MDIDRRTAMAAVMVAGVAVAAPPALAMGRASRLDFSKPQDRLRAFILMRGALDGRLVISWASARYYGVVDDQVEPVYGVTSAVFARFRPLADGGWETVNFELAWFTDPQTGVVVESFRNPYTGKLVKVPSGGNAPSKLRYGADMTSHLAKPVPGLELKQDLLPFDVRGDDVWITERSDAKVTPPGQVKPLHFWESTTLHARRSALDVAGAKQVASEVSFASTTSWRTWLEMGDRPGHLTAAGYGRTGASLATLNPAWIDATRARRPEVLRDPAAILAPLWDAK